MHLNLLLFLRIQCRPGIGWRCQGGGGAAGGETGLAPLTKKTQVLKPQRGLSQRDPNQEMNVFDAHFCGPSCDAQASIWETSLNYQNQSGGYTN